MVDISINRPVHLARRDKLYMRARRQLRVQFSGQSLEKRGGNLDMLIYLLEQAKGEAESALRGKSKSVPGWNMFKFLELLCDSAEAACAMVRHEALIVQDRSFLKAFMGKEAQGIMRTEIGYRKSADEIVQGMRSMVAAVDEAYHKLRLIERETCSSEGRERYRRAYRVA